PVKLGGGKQTRSLRLEDPNGRTYSLRSVQKFITSKTLPGGLQSEAAADIVSDGVSASYPYSNLSIGVLSDAAGIPAGNIRLVYIKDDPQLGEYRDEFRNSLALLETRLPDSVEKALDTDELAEKLKDDNDNEVDQKALLRARILDMFVMDLDRHEDQWQWGSVDKDKGKLYYPIPRDRDQAFYVNHGLLPGIAKWPWLLPQLQGFDARAKNIRRFNFSSRNLDRFFLNELKEADWKAEVDNFLSKMTDDVIGRALDKQPPEIHHLSMEKIKTTLKKRRNYLAAEVIDYYKFLSEIVDVTGSDKTELFDITKNEDGSVLLHVYKITKEGEQSTLMYERLFDPQDTKEIRLYGFGGNDRYMVKGTDDKIRIRMIGGEGQDSFENTTTSRNGGIIYDRKDGGNTIKGDFRTKLANDTVVNSFQRIYYKYNQVIPFISAGYNQDDGLFLGGSVRIIHHGFRKEPFKNSHNFTIKHALSTKAYDFRYNSEYIGVFGRKNDLLFDAEVRAPHNTTNFFGYGMDSEYDKSRPGEFKYYRARYQLVDLALLGRFNFSKKVIMELGPVMQFYSFDEDDEFNKVRFITDPSNGLNPATLFEKQSYLGGKFSFTVDVRDNVVMPQKGIYWYSSLKHLSGLNDAAYEVTQLNSDLSIHIPVIKNWLTIVNRTGGGHNFGDFEFYQAQYLGNEDNLRGYRKYRFAGRSKFYNNTELRLKLANFTTYLFPGSLGIMGFFDTGRVWVENDGTNKWASGYGGGIWISPVNRIVFSATYTISDEDKLPLIGFGWKF
ncbi:MAG TPA: BamA/TamA family outer membrane protein, partial [Chitinophagaceae bacterium]|nr:BamA/TamA family outer membrane protein [Chitinophagaceae bacterium]